MRRRERKRRQKRIWRLIGLLTGATVSRRSILHDRVTARGRPAAGKTRRRWLRELSRLARQLYLTPKGGARA